MAAPITAPPIEQNNDPAKGQSSAFFSLAVLITLALFVGGGGVRYALANLAVQIAALLALALHRHAFFGFWRTAPTSLKLLAGATLLLPIIHLIPLPEIALGSLPGRELVIEARNLAGADGWFPLSVDPTRTLVALTGLILPLAVMIIASKLPLKQLITTGGLIVAVGLANFALGIVQVMSNGELGLFYPENPMPGVLFGTFANRNSAGLFLVGALAFALLSPPPGKIAAFPAIRLASCVLLLVAIFLTQSRTAIVLAALPIMLGTAKLVLETRLANKKTGSRKRAWLASGLVVSALGLAVLTTIFAGPASRINDSFERFSASGDAREYIWEDARYSAQHYWPVGAGMGTFDEVFQLDESLENLSTRRAGRAHNDYLEVAIEAGLPGIALVAGWLGMVSWLSWRARRSPFRWSAWAGSVILFSLALQSLTDYPLRSQAMLGLAAFALIVLLRLGSIRRKPLR